MREEVIELAGKTYAEPRLYAIDCSLDPDDDTTMVLVITTSSQTSDGVLYYTDTQTGDIGESAPFVATVQADHATALEGAGYAVLT